MPSMPRVFTDARASLLASVALLVTLAGCGHPGKELPLGTYERGYAEFEGEYYQDAIENLKLFIRRSPTDDQADDAQFYVARAHMESGDYPVAAVEFEILRSDYPNSELVEEAFYMEGLCYVEQVPKIELDQTMTVKAIEHFRRYLRSFPDGEHREQAREELEKLELRMDEKRLRAIRLYRKMGRYEAAYVSLQALMEDRPQTPVRGDLLFMQGVLAERLDRPEEARRSWSELLQLYPDHPRVAEVRKALAGLRVELDEGSR